MTNFVLPLEQINNKQADIAGGKGASLGEMLQAGIQVPPGFIVMRAAFDEFMAVADPGGDVGRICQELARDEIDVTTATSTIRELLTGVEPP
jgi:pyruvate,water dikinase